MGKLVQLALGGKEPPHNPNRIELARAIDELAALEQSVPAKQEALSRARAMVGQAITEQNEAEKSVDEARNALRTRMVEFAMTGSRADRDSAMASAHGRLAAANETLAAAQAAAEIVRGAHEDTLEALDSARKRRDAAATKIVAGEIDPLHEEAIELRDRYMAKLLELRFVAQIGEVSWPPTERSKNLECLFQYPVASSPFAHLPDDPRADTVLAVWRQAVENLKRDAGADLPSEGTKK